MLDALHRCPHCGWSCERINSINALVRPEGTLAPSPSIGDGLDPEGPWALYLLHFRRPDDAELRLRILRRHCVVLRLPVRRSGDVHRRWIDLPPGASANDSGTD